MEKLNKKKINDNEISIAYGNDNSININIFNNKILMSVVGSFDNNLRELEKISGSKIYFRGHSIVIKGDKNANEKVKDAIQYLIERFKSNKKIEKNDVITSLNRDMVKIAKSELSSQTLEEIIKTPKKNSYTKIKKTKRLCKSS